MRHLEAEFKCSVEQNASVAHAVFTTFLPVNVHVIFGTVIQRKGRKKPQ